ncbi:MAG: ThuA domain-containing protein, partial [Bacteroidia bacterium]|nr:ThuA domain-containing protein [Bacteroidia bacterium]
MFFCLNRSIYARLVLIICLLLTGTFVFAQKSPPRFKVIAFYTGKNDRAHVSFVHESNRWFAETAKKYKFSY